MIKSVIKMKRGCHYFIEFSEMLIPKVIGRVVRGFLNTTRINRLLPLGQRYHGYEA